MCDVNKSREKETKALAVKNGARMAKNGWAQWMTEGGTRIHITHEGEEKKRAIEIPGRGVERREGQVKKARKRNEEGIDQSRPILGGGRDAWRWHRVSLFLLMFCREGRSIDSVTQFSLTNPICVLESRLETLARMKNQMTDQLDRDPSGRIFCCQKQIKKIVCGAVIKPAEATMSNESKREREMRRSKRMQRENSNCTRDETKKKN